MNSKVSKATKAPVSDRIRSATSSSGLSKIFLGLLLLCPFTTLIIFKFNLDFVYVAFFLIGFGLGLVILFLRICASFQTDFRNSKIAKFEQEFQQISDPIGLLIENPDSSLAYSELIKLVASKINPAYIAIYTFDDQTGSLILLASNDESDKALFPKNLSAAPLHTIDQSNDHIVDISTHFKTPGCCGIGLFDREALYGFIVISRTVGHGEEAELLWGFSTQISKLILSSRCAQISRRQDLHQERSVIARELHDSLAQSLTYLKIQLTRLQIHIDRNKQLNSNGYLQIENAIMELRSNLNLAYGQLRELMTTFRLTMNGKDLRYAIEESINEFRQRTNIAFDSDIRISGEDLNAQEELQLLQIVREALSNVVRHSRATRAKISLSFTDKKIALWVSDNGVGLASLPEPGQHHGLVIMQERSQRLKGNLQVETSASGGTNLRISFTPELLRTREILEEDRAP